MLTDGLALWRGDALADLDGWDAGRIERAPAPRCGFTDAVLDRTAAAFENPDYVEVVLHSYRHRLGLTAGDPRYDELEARLTALPPVPVPAVTLHGLADGNFPASDGSPSARFFTGPRVHHQLPTSGTTCPRRRRARSPRRSWRRHGCKGAEPPAGPGS